ncbi:MAG: VanZ family protein [Verrucomicrobiia bacterium]
MKGIPNGRWFGWLSLVIVAGYLVVGLWPFAFRPPNRVSWLANHAGLHFEPHGIACDPAPLPMPGLNAATGKSANFTLELWLAAQHEPANNVFDILTIHNPSLPFDFTLCQWKQDFLLRATTRQTTTTGKIPEVGVDDALPEGKPRFITVRGNGAGTDFFLDGLAAGNFPQFVLDAAALDGQLILGNNATGKHSWTGRLFGLALYNRALNTAEIARHHTLWTQGHAAQLSNAPGLRALYLFDEGRGQQAEDSSGNRHHVVIPMVFQPIHRELLIPPWKDIAYDRPDYSDIVINILGFLPFGFCFYLYRCSLRPNQRAASAVLVVFTGAAVSLTIEVIQAWLPNRTSSITDLLTNTAGTLLGVALALAIRHTVTNAESAPEVR